VQTFADEQLSHRASWQNQLAAGWPWSRFESRGQNQRRLQA
jgi:hypothetical protein